MFVHQDLRDTAGDWFYWQFRVRGAAGRTLKFQFTKSDVIGVCGPAVSRDAGRTWTWLGTNTLEGASLRYTFPLEEHDTRFAVAVPYLESNLRDFLGRCPGNGTLKIETLCRSAKGRSVELLRVGQIRGEPKARVLLTARHEKLWPVGRGIAGYERRFQHGDSLREYLRQGGERGIGTGSWQGLGKDIKVLFGPALARPRFQKFLRWLYKQQEGTVFRTRRNRSRTSQPYH
ncbi:MAG TPA: hypothetical protein VNT26_21640 [Candidatus Sulfotelmatobacter sp.]|nr:hypothetical protein [Candidatus Sulfotelmatobacter sp.]